MKNKILLLILSIIGFFDSSYLTILHYKKDTPPCSLVHGCEKVLTSQFATISGIPLALLGVIFFLILIFLLLLNSAKYFKFLIWVGMVVAIILTCLQAFVLHSFCQYCLLVELIVFLTFVLSFRTPKQNNLT